MAELLVVFLMPFKHCTKRFECNANEPEIDYIFFAYDSLFNHIEDVKTALEGATALAALPLTLYMLEALCNMEEKFKIYYKKTELLTAYSDAMILNPCCKLSIFEMETWSDEDSRKYSVVVAKDSLKVTITWVVITLQLPILHPHQPLHLVNGQAYLYSMMTMNLSKLLFSGQQKDIERTMIVILTCQTMSGLRHCHGGVHIILPFKTLVSWHETTSLFQHQGAQWKDNSLSPEESSVGKGVA